MSEISAAIRQEVLSASESAYGSGIVDYKSLMAIVAQVVTQVAADGRLTSEDAEAVIEAAEQLYDEYVRPIDVPYVPEPIESWVEDYIKSGIRPSVEALFDHIFPAA